MNSYAWLYHAHHSLYIEDVPFWSVLADRQGDPVLELGCGTGRVFLPLLRAGHRVYGLDNRLDMLSVLSFQLERDVSPDERARAFFWQGDLRAFHLARRFALILLPCNTLSHLSPVDRQRAFDCARAHLQPGGIFAASIPNPLELAKLPPEGDLEIEDIFPHPFDGEPVQVSSGWVRDSTGVKFIFHYDHLHPDGSLTRCSAEANHRLDPPEAYIRDLKGAGFQQVESYGDFDWRSFKRSDPNLILVARRPAA